MCLIVAKAKGVSLPEDDYLRNGYESNNDGAGICYWKKGSNKVIIKKDFINVEHLIFWLKRHIEKEDSLIVHFRNATSGLIDEGNRHPFPLTKDEKLIRKVSMNCDLAVAHNGVMYTFNNKMSELSDTQNFIITILSDKLIKTNIYKNETLRKLIGGMVGSYNKFAFLNKEGSLLFLGEFIKEKVDEGEVYYSNKSYETKIVSYGFRRYAYERVQTKLLENSSSSNGNLKENEKTKIEEKEEKEEKEEDLVAGVYTKVNKKDDTLYYGECENCNYHKNVRPVYNEERRRFFLCRKCRQKVRRGILKLETDYCSSCYGEFIKSNLFIKYNQFPLCQKCSVDYQ